MKTVGIIAEFNPLHNGHKYLIDTARKKGADIVIAVMSGEFLQSGEIAFASKELRMNMAIRAGVDIVILLPNQYSTGSAEIFACGGVSILNGLGCVDEIIFGSEYEDINKSIKLAELLNDEPLEYKGILQKYLKSGLSFPAARSAAVNDFFGNMEYSSILQAPNSILGLEYIRAIKRFSSDIVPVAIKRTDNGYHSQNIAEKYVSATAIRALFSDDNNDCSSLLSYIPEELTAIYQNNFKKEYPVFRDDIMPALLYKLFSSELHSDKVYELSEELSNRISTCIRADFPSSYEGFIQMLNSRNTTYGHISRVMAHLLLDIKEKPPIYCPYARILGFSNAGKDFMRELNRKSTIPLITNLSKAEAVLTDIYGELSRAHEILKTDNLAYDLYQIILKKKYNAKYIPECSLKFMSMGNGVNDE